MRFQTTYICGKCKKVIYQYEVDSDDKDGIEGQFKKQAGALERHKRKRDQRMKSHLKICGRDTEIDVHIEPVNHSKK